jgi:hypothetical protein
MDRLLDVVAIFSVTLALMVLTSVRRAHIRVEYSVSWLTAAAVLFIVSRNARLLEMLAQAIGASSPSAALLIFTMCVFLVVFYRFSIRISDLKDANIALAQRLAILEYQLQSSNEDQQAKSSS